MSNNLDYVVVIELLEGPDLVVKELLRCLAQVLKLVLVEDFECDCLVQF